MILDTAPSTSDAEAEIRHKRRRAARWLGGHGIEIGALNNPLEVPNGVSISYVDRAPERELRRQYGELASERFVPIDIIGDAHDLSAIATESVDFVIANHLLEHLEDPLRGLQEMTRVLRRNGVLYLALPDPRATFDRDRELTSIEHVVTEFREGTSHTREAHFTEWVATAEPLVEWMQAAGVGGGPERVRDLMKLDYSIHFHVWRPDTFLEVVSAARREAGVEMELVDFMPCNATGDIEFIFVFLKGVASTPPAVPPLDACDASAEFSAKLDAMAAEIKSLHDQIRAVHASAEVAECGRREAEARLAAIEESRSWRMTAPLRRAVRIAARGIGKRW